MGKGSRMRSVDTYAPVYSPIPHPEPGPWREAHAEQRERQDEAGCFVPHRISLSCACA